MSEFDRPMPSVSLAGDTDGTEIDERTYEIEAQSALGDNKSVNVKVVDEDGEKYAFSTGSETFGKEVQDAYQWSKKTQEIADKLDKIPFLKRVKNKTQKVDSKLSWYFNVTPFEQTQKNEEDKNGPLYYRYREVKGGFDVGIQGTMEWPIWSIPFNKLPLPDAWITNIENYVKAEVLVKAKADAGGELKIEQKSKKWVNTTTWSNEKATINPATIRLKAEFGAEAEVSVLKDFSLFSIGATASGMVNAEILTFGYYNGSFGIDYFREGVNLDTRIGGFVSIAGLKYELSPIFKQFKLYEK